MSFHLPPPSLTPPSINKTVHEYLDVLHEVREVRREQARQELMIARLFDAQTADRLTLGRVERKLDRVLKFLGVTDG